MFLGRFAHNLDTKGRIAIPAKFRAGLAQGLVVTRGIDSCLTVYPMAKWTELAARVSALSMADFDSRQFQRNFFSDAVDGELDAQGRVILTAELRAHAAIDREALVIGMNTHLEIWDPARWEEASAASAAGMAQIAERLAGQL